MSPDKIAESVFIRLCDSDLKSSAFQKHAFEDQNCSESYTRQGHFLVELFKIFSFSS